MCNSKRCDRCCRLIRTTCISVDGSAIVLTIPPISFKNKERRCLRICTPIPEITPGTNPAIFIQDGANLYQCYTAIGNLARAGNIGCDRQWSIVFGDDPDHITIFGGLIDLVNCPHTGDGYQVGV